MPNRFVDNRRHPGITAMDVDWFNVYKEFPAGGIDDANLNGVAKERVVNSMGSATISVGGVTVPPSAEI